MGLKSATGAGQKPDACHSRRVNEQPAIDYEVRGGLTGGLDNWLVYRDGLLCRWGGVDLIRLPLPGFRVPARRHLKESGKIPQANVAEILNEATRLGFFGMPKGDRCEGAACAQCMSYRITIRSGTRKKTISTCDAAKKAPGLSEVISKVQRILPR